MLSKARLLLILCIACAVTYAAPNDKSVSESMTRKNIKRFALTKQAIVLNTQVDNIEQLDPRLKSIIMYAHYESNPVYIYYYNEDNKRYVAKLLDLFKANKVNIVNAEIKPSTNLIEHNLIKIYLGDPQNAIYK